jgi:hypothetical protein
MSLVLSETPMGRLEGQELRDALFDHACREEFDDLDWNDSVTQLVARVGLMRRLEGEQWPDWGLYPLINTAQIWLYPALEGVTRLEGPMRAVAALDPTLRSVADLSGPMARVAGLGGGLDAVAGLQQPLARLGNIGPSLDAAAALSRPMTQVAAMRPSLDAVAALQPSLAQVAALDRQLASVADLKPSMTALGGLREPMERVAALQEPMSRVAALGDIIASPMRLVIYGVLALALWAGVTFAAVRLAIIRASLRRERNASSKVLRM